jgi:hypothetical protein
MIAPVNKPKKKPVSRAKRRAAAQRRENRRKVGIQRRKEARDESRRLAKAYTHNHSGLIDGLGQPVAQWLVTPFRRREKILKIVAQLAELRTQLMETCDKTDPLFTEDRGIVLLQATIKHIELTVPFATCPRCAGWYCETCQSRGWVTRQQWEAIHGFGAGARVTGRNESPAERRRRDDRRIIQAMRGTAGADAGAMAILRLPKAEPDTEERGTQGDDRLRASASGTAGPAIARVPGRVDGGIGGYSETPARGAQP